MGGCGSGSGSRWNSKTTTESQHRIDIRWLKKQGYLKPGTMGSLSWSSRGEQTGFINYSMDDDRMTLNYRYRRNGGEWQPVEQSVSFDRTPCHYGGYRSWFVCSKCGKRVAIIYGAGKYFHCRHCYNLTYSSQQEGEADRLSRKARKIRRKLGTSENLFESILFKPKNMHQKTFDRLRHKANFASNLSLQIATEKWGIL